MGATGLLGRSTVRGRERALVAVVVLLAIGVGVAIAAFTAAWRTDHAYADHLRRARVNPVVVNPLFMTDRVLDVARSIPGVERVSQSSLLNIRIDGIDPDLQQRLTNTTQPIGPLDGRYSDVDRPVIVRGRMSAAADEMIVNRGAAAAYGIDIGDRLTIHFVPAQPNGPTPEDPAVPIGTEQVTVVGIGVFADEVLPDDLYRPLKLLFSPELAAKYSCLRPQPATDDARTIDEISAEYFSPECSNDATLLSLQLADGDDGVEQVLAALGAGLAAESARLPTAMREAGVAYGVVPTITSVESERVHRSLQPVVLALRLLGATVLAVTLVIAITVLDRIVRRSEDELGIWLHLGVERRRRAAAVAVPPLIAIVCGLAGALIVGWLASGFGPVASVSVLDRSPALGVPLAVLALLPAALVVTATAVGASAWLASSARRRSGRLVASGRAVEYAAVTGSVPFALGVRAATTGRARVVLVAAATVAAIGTAVAVYTSNLVDLVGNPARYGWTYDVGAIVNNGFDGADADGVAATLDRPGVAAWGVGDAAISATVDGVQLPAIADLGGLADVGMPIIDGVMPRADHEVALGSSSASRLGVTVGDEVTVETDLGVRDARVSGIVVLPDVGAFLSDRAAMGTGIVIAQPMFAAMVAAAEQGAGVPPGTFSQGMGGFVAVDLEAGVDAAAFVGELGDDVLRWDVAGRPVDVRTSPVRPSPIADLASIDVAPAALVVVAAALLGGVIAVVGRAARSRRRELAILRTFGCERRALCAAVRWQALTVVAIGLVVGIPVGVVVGARAWSSFASTLGLGTSAAVPWVGMGAAVAVGVVVAVVAAAGFGRHEASRPPASVLRETIT